MTARRRSFEVRATSRAPIEQVWSVIADASGWNEWAGVTRSSLEREGDPAPDGVGAIRRFGVGRFASREKVIEFDPPSHLAYVLLSGMPVSDYRADVFLSPDRNGTTIDWRSSLAPRYPGTGRALAWFMKTVVAGFARRAARWAERADGEPGRETAGA